MPGKICEGIRVIWEAILCVVFIPTLFGFVETVAIEKGICVALEMGTFVFRTCCRIESFILALVYDNECIQTLFAHVSVHSERFE